MPLHRVVELTPFSAESSNLQHHVATSDNPTPFWHQW